MGKPPLQSWRQTLLEMKRHARVFTAVVVMSLSFGCGEDSQSVLDSEDSQAVDSAVGARASGSYALNWQRVSQSEAVFGGSGAQHMNSVTVGGPGLVAVGNTESYSPEGTEMAAAVWTSIDGSTWNRLEHDEQAFDGAAMRSVVPGGPGLVAVGVADGPNGATVAVVWTSRDGALWERVSHDEAVFGGTGAQRMDSVTVGGPGLVAVGTDDGRLAAAVWTSTDGFNWQRIEHDDQVFGGGQTRMRSVTAGGPGLVAVGIDVERPAAAVWTSPDGINWQRIAQDDEVFKGETNTAMWSVTVGGPGLVAVGSEGPDSVVWASADGTSWERVDFDDQVFGLSIMWTVSQGGPGLVAGGRDSRTLAAAIWTSPDGLSWNRVPHEADVFGGDGVQSIFGIEGGVEGIVAVGYDEGQQAAVIWIGQ